MRLTQSKITSMVAGEQQQLTVSSPLVLPVLVLLLCRLWWWWEHWPLNAVLGQPLWQQVWLVAVVHSQQGQMTAGRTHRLRDGAERAFLVSERGCRLYTTSLLSASLPAAVWLRSAAGVLQRLC